MKKLGLFFLICTLIVSSIVSLNVSYAADLSFPYNATYAAGFNSQADDQAQANEMLRNEYNEWKAARVTQNGAGGNLRVQRGSSDSYDTVSEGIGYGMVLSAYFDDRTTFDSLWKYAKAHFNSNGLMGWHVDANGNFVGTGGSGAATDAEEDMAIALIMATKKWGTYESDAKTLLRNMMSKEVEPGTYVLKPGDTWGGSNVTNPSYFAPGYYRVYAEFTGDQNWLKVADKCYEILNKCRNSNTGLVPDWCTAQGTQASGQGYDFKYDAVRTPWRIAVDYSWYGTSSAKTVCDGMSKFFKNGGISSIGDGYSISGNKISNNHSSTFVSCIASGAMTGFDATFAKDMYNDCLKTKDAYSTGWSYYGNSLRMMILLHLTGNFPNPLKYSPASATPTPTSTPSRPSNTPTPTKQTGNQVVEDVNRDRAVNMADVVQLATCFNATRGTNKYIANCDINNDGSINMSDVIMIAVKFNYTY
ncbi:glycosyl hydrolase family 8 [Pseudobacteroides cellulosolvens]|uniref:Licheninase n=1 Tax=Pseudobacteroides cellulosolvens ATCC 35603 = DSM 2933 TaxID=398512 RepID=A0A0L6JR53_9FIRM|nr:glycosyl hydrolase family 8 [Pseudobacteroides cellulosolvens]KNY28253.1 Licheninase [Pseudobacteroides cellulosolvens ATCC 35603 = DSM 2933]